MNRTTKFSMNKREINFLQNDDRRWRPRRSFIKLLALHKCYLCYSTLMFWDSPLVEEKDFLRARYTSDKVAREIATNLNNCLKTFGKIVGTTAGTYTHLLLISEKVKSIFFKPWGWEHIEHIMHISGFVPQQNETNMYATFVVCVFWAPKTRNYPYP